MTERDISAFDRSLMIATLDGGRLPFAGFKLPNAAVSAGCNGFWKNPSPSDTVPNLKFAT
jgi:hypothetical protein